MDDENRFVLILPPAPLLFSTSVMDTSSLKIRFSRQAVSEPVRPAPTIVTLKGHITSAKQQRKSLVGLDDLSNGWLDAIKSRIATSR